MRTWMRSVALVGALLGASEADAWLSHSLQAEAGNVFHGDASDDPLDVEVDALFQSGVCGVNDGCFFAHATANNYNAVLRPPVVFCRDGRAREVVRRETYEDLTLRDQ